MIFCLQEIKDDILKIATEFVLEKMEKLPESIHIDMKTFIEKLKDENGKPLESATSYRHQFDQLYGLLENRIGKANPAHE